jgi:hypothetical protein
MTKGRSRIEPEKVNPGKMQAEKPEKTQDGKVETISAIKSDKQTEKTEIIREKETSPVVTTADVVTTTAVVTTAGVVKTPDAARVAQEVKAAQEINVAREVKAAQEIKGVEVEEIKATEVLKPIEITAAEKPPEELRIPENVPPDVRESIDIVIRLNFSPDLLRSLETLAFEHRDFLAALKKLGPDGVIEVCKLADDDDDYILTSKIKLISLINRVSKHEFFHNLMLKAGAAIQAVRRLKELLLK